MIYLIQSGEDGPVKIGYCAEGTIERRLAELQTGSPEELHIRHAFPGGSIRQERQLHGFLGRFRIRGEWFAPAVLDEEYHLRHTEGFARLVLNGDANEGATLLGV